MSRIWTPDKPIVTSLLEVDWYKFPMSSFAFRRHRNVRVRYAFKNRHAQRVCLPVFIRLEDLRREIEHVRTLRFSDREISHLRESRHIPLGLFSEEFLQALQTMELPPVEIAWAKGDYRIETEGEWWVTMFWETIIMNIVNELYFRELARRAGRTTEELWAEGTRRLMKKVKILKTRPDLTFSPFGLRRGFMVRWSRFTERMLCEELPTQVVGISNVRSAMENDKRPSGTCAHEMLMVYAGLYGATDEGLRSAPIRLTGEWFDDYGPEWSVAIPDTFGSESFLADMPKRLVDGIVAWKIDSGDPYERGEVLQNFFEQWGLDPRKKRAVFSDGLDVTSMVGLYDHFHERMGVAEGPGTNFTNDVGLTPVSMVVKASHVLRNGVWVPLVKLSDNLAKASGPPEEIERYTRVFEYRNTASVECTY
ncbi:MAG: hypothetical protein Q7R80_01230 [bacterium]|nr:hypothetical protein [bacterium]